MEDNKKMNEVIDWLQEVIDNTQEIMKKDDNEYLIGYMSGLALAQQYIKHKMAVKCPRCGKTITGHPAISRTDNHTEICSDCGIAEALEAFMAQEGE